MINDTQKDQKYGNSKYWRFASDTDQSIVFDRSRTRGWREKFETYTNIIATEDSLQTLTGVVRRKDNENVIMIYIKWLYFLYLPSVPYSKLPHIKN